MCGVSQKISGCIIGCKGTVFTLLRYNIKTSSRGRSFPPRGEPCKIRVVQLFHVFVLYLVAICYLLHEIFSPVNECMYAILQFTVT